MTVQRKWRLRGVVLSALWLATVACGADDPPAAPLSETEIAAAIAQLKLEGLRPETFSAVRVHRDLEFVRHGDEALRLDLYLPTERAEHSPRPCVIVIAGGGFLAQNQKRFGPVAAYLASQGYAAASISYRGTPAHRFRDTVQDAKAAVRWVRANAARYGIDPDRLAAMGQSAGGHLAGMLAVTGGVEEFEGTDGHPGVSSRVQAAVSLAGVFDFISRLKDGGQQQADEKTAKLLKSKRETNGNWIGAPFSETSAEWKAAAPITYVGSGDAPLLLVHCRGDGTVPFAQSVQMYDALHPLSPQTRLVLYDRGGHSVVGTPQINAQMWQETLRFLDDVFQWGDRRRPAP